MLDPRGGQSDLEQNADSTRAPSMTPDLEDERKNGDVRSTEQKNDGVETSPQEKVAEGEYPQGFRLIFIVVALVISMFLVALDMVSTTSSRDR